MLKDKPFKFKTTTLVLCFFLCLTGFNLSQGESTASLKKVIYSEQNTLKEARALVNLSDILYATNEDTVLVLCEQALSILKNTNLKKLNSKTKFEYNQIKAKSLNNIGYIFYNSGNSTKAIYYFIEATKIREKINDEQSLCESYNNIAFIYKQQEDTLKAISYYKKSLRNAQKTKSLPDISHAFSGIATMLDIHESHKALEYYFKSLDIEKKLDNKFEIAKREHNIGIIYQNNNDLIKAQKWYLKSIETKREIEDNKGISTSLIALANLKLEEESYNEAEKYALEAYKISKEIDHIQNIIQTAGQLYTIYLHQKKYKEALDKYVEQTENNEILLMEANETETVKLQMQYDFDKKHAKDSLNKINEKEKFNIKLNLEKDKQFRLYLFIAISLIFLVITFNRFKKTNNQKIIIEQQNKEVVQKNKEITDSIMYAKKIQYTLLANKELLDKNLQNHFIIFKPKDIVSGDFYWALRKDNFFYLAVCDSTGHGVPGAFMSLLNISFLNEAINEKNIILPNEILNHVRKRLIDNLGLDGSQDGMDATLLCFNFDNNEVIYSAAYNAPVIISNNEIKTLKADRMPIGKSPKEHISFTNHYIQTQSGDTIYLFTDGYADQFGGPKGKKFKVKTLLEKLQEISPKTLEEQEKELESNFDKWKGNLEQVDDILIVGIRV